MIALTEMLLRNDIYDSVTFHCVSDFPIDTFIGVIGSSKYRGARCYLTKRYLELLLSRWTQILNALRLPLNVCKAASIRDLLMLILSLVGILTVLVLNSSLRLRYANRTWLNMKSSSPHV